MNNVCHFQAFHLFKNNSEIWKDWKDTVISNSDFERIQLLVNEDVLLLIFEEALWFMDTWYQRYGTRFELKPGHRFKILSYTCTE